MERSIHASPVVPVLHPWLRRACPAVHAARATAVVTLVEALVLGAKVALTHLGCNLRSAAYAKHNINSIKRVDRLLGNRHLHGERSLVHRALAHRLLAATPRPILLIDWADCGDAKRRWLVLRVAVPLGGRAVPIYEECARTPKLPRGATRQTPAPGPAHLVALPPVSGGGCRGDSGRGPRSAPSSRSR